MIEVSVKQLASAIAEADAFQMPGMNEGTSYLYHTVYSRLSRDIDIKLSDIDFDAFEPEDIDSLNDLHSDVFERNCYAASGMMSALRQVSPVCKSVCYV